MADTHILVGQRLFSVCPSTSLLHSLSSLSHLRSQTQTYLNPSPPTLTITTSLSFPRAQKQAYKNMLGSTGEGRHSRARRLSAEVQCEDEEEGATKMKMDKGAPSKKSKKQMKEKKANFDSDDFCSGTPLFPSPLYLPRSVFVSSLPSFIDILISTNARSYEQVVFFYVLVPPSTSLPHARSSSSRTSRWWWSSEGWSR